MSPSTSQDGQFEGVSLNRRHVSPTRAQVNGAIAPPLLMPPPTTFLGWVRQQCYLVIHSLNATSPPAFRFCLFLLKMAVLARACWPGSFNMTVGGALVIAAAVDLSWTLQLWFTGTLTLLHILFVFFFQQWAELCQIRREPWEWSAAFDVDRGQHP